MVKRSRQKYSHRFNFKITEEMHDSIHAIAAAARRDGVTEDVAAVVRCMITRQLPFFMEYVSRQGKLPPCEPDATSTETA